MNNITRRVFKVRVRPKTLYHTFYLQWIHTCNAHVHIHVYGTYINTKHTYNYTLFAGNIGGQLGLFIGCSFLTAFEFLECILMSTLYHCKRGGKKDESKAKDINDTEMGNNNRSFKDTDSERSPTHNGELYTVPEPSGRSLKF